MSKNKKGRETEERCRKLLLTIPGATIQQIDWTLRLFDRYVNIECKYKTKLWRDPNNPNFVGAGMDNSQIFLRNILLEDKKERTILFIFVKNDLNIYYQYVDILLEGECVDCYWSIPPSTIFSINSFKIWGKEPLKEIESFIYFIGENLS